jgi:acetyl-CoA acetyltransferase
MTAYVFDAVRTPFGRYGGALAGVRPDDLAAHVVRAIVDRNPGIEPDDVMFGNANGAGEDNRDVARMAVLLAGLPTSSRAARSTACAAPASTPRCRRAARWRPATPTSSSSAASSR